MLVLTDRFNSFGLAAEHVRICKKCHIGAGSAHLQLNHVNRFAAT